MKTVVARSVPAILPLAVSALGLTGLPAALAEKVTAAPQACANSGNGEFALEWGAVLPDLLIRRPRGEPG